MDTDDLSDKIYSAVIIEAERFDHCLALQFGVIASSCRDVEKYLKTVKKLIKAKYVLVENNGRYELFNAQNEAEEYFFDTEDELLTLQKAPQLTED